MVDGNKECSINEFQRASGLCICDQCGKNYFSHKPHRDWPWLRELCNGELVKL